MNNKNKAPQRNPPCDADDQLKDLNGTWATKVHGVGSGEKVSESTSTKSSANGIYYMEKHETRNGKLTKIKGFNVGNNFVPTYMTKEDAKGWVKRSGEIFPPKEMWAALRKHYGKYYLREVLELHGMGLFTTCDIKAGDFVGIYAGMKTRSAGEYVMEIGETLLDGSPRGDDKLFYMGRMNDWYWG